jgi:hypothetical protein
LRSNVAVVSAAACCLLAAAMMLPLLLQLPLQMMMHFSEYSQ